MIHRLTLLFVLFSTVCYNQPLYFSFPYPISGPTTGTAHPRVTLVNENPLLVWGNSSGENLFYANWNGAGFDIPVQLTYNGEMVMLGYAEGPVLKSKGDSVYVIYVSMGASEHRVYLRRSFDGGQSFSDTILVNDRANGVSLEYANMELDENGHPAVNFIRNEIGDVPKYVFYRSADFGSTFSSEVNATPDTTTQPCECCPASILLENNYVYISYRNNNSNIRDFYVSVSQDGGNTFDSLKRVDFSNYLSSSCPASGSSSIIAGDSVLSVFMTKINNQPVIRANTLHKNTLVAGPEYYIDPNCLTGGYTMNYPEIAGSGDTIAIVWQDNRAGHVKCYIASSTTGLSGLSAPQMISDFTGTFHYNPHLVFKNGVFHITWRDFANGVIWYRRASFDSGILSSAENKSSTLRIYPNPASETVFISSESKSALIEIVDISGKIIYQTQLQLPEKINTGSFAPGVYEIRISSDKNRSTEKLIIQR